MKVHAKLISAAVCAAFGLASGSALAAKPGTYTATAQGHNGPVSVTMTVDDAGKISKLEVGENKETIGIADSAIRILPSEIVKHQSLGIDSLTGATFTSKAILAAAQDCAKQADLDLAALLAPVKKTSGKVIRKKADVVVIGGGGAGLSAAVGAAENSATVIVIEKTASLGGNTMRAGGGYNFADPELEGRHVMTEAQKAMVRAMVAEEPKNEAHKALLDKVRDQFAAYEKSGAKGVFDSPEYHAIQTFKSGDYAADINLVYELCKLAPVTAKHLAEMGFKWHDYSSQYVGALWPRSHDAANFKSGFGFIQTYEATIRDKHYPVEYLMQTRANELMINGSRVAGVKAVDADGNTIEIDATKGVVIASGGFGANVEMRMKYDKLWNGILDEKFPTTNSPAITGDGIRMAEKVGANLVGMEYIQLLIGDPETGVTSTLVGQGTSMYVNREGKRFVNELERRDNLVKAILAQPQGDFFWITTEANAQIDDKGLNKYGLLVADLIKQGKIAKSDTIEGLAPFIGCDPAELKKTVEAWREMCRTQKDPQFGRAAFMEDVTLDEGPYYAVHRSPSVHHTMGGIQINEKAQVIGKDGKPIPGLWAAGEVTGGLHGKNRVGANAIPDALSFGRIAGIGAATSK